MKWFMHQSQAHRDTKLKKVLIKYGAEGYGLYWYCIEHICADIDPKLTFELEHDVEILAHDLKIDTLKTQEIMLYMVKLGLFEISENVVYCLKLARYIGDKYTRNPELKAIIKGQKQLSPTVRDMSGTVPDSPRLSPDCPPLEEKRREEKNTRRFAPPSEEEVSRQIAEMGYRHSVASEFCNFYGSKNWMVGKNKMSDWRKALGGWESRKSKDAKPDQAEASYF